MSISLRGRPRVNPTLDIEAGDQITGEELDGPDVPRHQQSPQLLRIRETHHDLARTLAMGYNDKQAAEITGFSTFRIHLLRQDPAFKELIAVYMDKLTEKMIEQHAAVYEDLLRAERINARLTREMYEEIGDKDNKDDHGNYILPHQRLTEFMATAGDRSGNFAKRTTSVNVNTSFSGMAEILREARLANEAKLLNPPPSAVEAEVTVRGPATTTTSNLDEAGGT